MSLYGQYQLVPTSVPDGQSALARIDSARRQIITGEAGMYPVAVTISAAAGSVVWTRTSITMTGSSQTALAANATRKGLIVSNRIGNAQLAYDISGGTVTALNGLQLLGGVRDAYTEDSTPLTAITVIGTNTQIMDVWEGN